MGRRQITIKAKYLVINADDYGLDENINRGIIESFSSGIVRSVSLVPNGAVAGEAMQSLHKYDADIGVGVHLCLVEEKSILPKKEIPSLVDDENLFPGNFRRLLYRIYCAKISLAEIDKELSAQIKRVLDHNIKPTHLDSHQYTHLIPPVFEIAVKLAKKFKIKWIRYPGSHQYRGPVTLNNCAKKACLSLASSAQRAMLDKNEIRCADFSYGLLGSGKLDANRLSAYLNNLNPGLTDITAHPGYAPNDKKYLSWKYCWEDELAALNSENISCVAAAMNIKLVNYAEQ